MCSLLFQTALAMLFLAAICSTRVGATPVDVNTLVSLYEDEGYVDSLYYRQVAHLANIGDKKQTEEILARVIDAASKVEDTEDAKTGKEVLKELQDITKVDSSSNFKLIELYSKTLKVIEAVIPKVEKAVNHD